MSKAAKIRNFVAKHAPRAGAGVHQDKQGSRASRARQKANLRREMKNGSH